MSSSHPPLFTAPRPLVCGVDPGLTGAIAFYDIVTKTLRAVHDMPVTLQNGVKEKSCIDAKALALLIDSYARETRLAVVEKVGARPGQGVTGMFRFGYSAGLVEGALSSSMVPTHFTVPSVWKSLMGLSHDKNLSRMKAIEKFPQHANFFERKKDDGRAEASLLALFGAQRLIRE